MEDTINLLLVEDKLELRRLISLVLVGESDLAGVVFTVMGAGTLDQATSALIKYHPSLILLDLNLPDSSGEDTLKAMLANAPGVPIIAMSGNLSYEQACRMIELGAEDFLAKSDLGSRIALQIMVSITRYRCRLNEKYPQ